MTDKRAGEMLLRAGALADSRDALRLEAEKVAHSYLRGPHGRKRAGSGEKFWQFRNYHAGDMPRDIDWRQTAKRDDVFVREREHDAAQSLWVWRDASASMAYSSDRRLMSKADYAEVLVLAVSALALEGGERVGALGSGQSARSHAAALGHIQAELSMTATVGSALTPLAQRGICLIASDFYMDVAAVDAACAAIGARQGRVVLVQICDPAEENLPWHGRVRFEDIEVTGDYRMIDDADALRTAYREKFLAHRAVLADIAARHHGVLVEITTSLPLADALQRVIDQIAQPDRRAM